MLTNNNLYDRLDICVVGCTWPANFYDWIPDPAVREPLQRIATETQEDLSSLANTLQNLGVQVLRPSDQPPANFDIASIPAPPMNPGDHMCVLGSLFVHTGTAQSKFYHSVFEHLQHNMPVTLDRDIVCAARHFQLQDRVIVARADSVSWHHTLRTWRSLTTKPCLQFPLLGHIDGWFSPATPGLVISDTDDYNRNMLQMFYKTCFPDHEIVACDGSWRDNQWSVQDWQTENQGRWWVTGEEQNIKFHDFVQQYLSHWVGNAQESVFDVNIVVVDERNVVLRQTNNEILLRALDRYGVTVHQVPFRHATFWDGCVNCVTLPLSRTQGAHI